MAEHKARIAAGLYREEGYACDGRVATMRKT